MRVNSDDGIELELHDFGGDGPPLLISHATGFLAAVYRPLATALGARFHVWAVDFRGHGDSTARPDGDQDWHGMTRDLLACVDALRPAEPIVGFGHSMGGAITLDVARLRPEVFRSIVVYEPIVTPVAVTAAFRGPSNSMAAPARRRRPSFGSRTEALTRYASRPPLNRFRTDVLWAYIDEGFRELADGSVTLKCPPELEAATFEGAGSVTQGDLGRIQVPVLVMAGALEPEQAPAQFAPLTAKALPNSDFLVYPTFSHFGPFQDPLRIALDLLEFVDRQPG